MLARSLLRCQHHSGVLKTFRSRVVRCQSLVTSGRSVMPTAEGTCLHRVGSTKPVGRNHYGRIALGIKSVQEKKLQERIQELEHDFAKQSQTVAELQTDVLNLMRNEVARLSEEKYGRGIAGVKGVARPANVSHAAQVSLQDSGVKSNETENLDIGGRLGSLENQLGQLSTSIRVYNEAVACQQLHFDRLERFVEGYRQDVGHAAGGDVAQRVDAHLTLILKGLERERAAHGSAMSVISSRLDGIENRIRTQESIIAQLSGKSGIVRVGGWVAPPALGFVAPWLSSGPNSPILASSKMQAARAVLEDTLGISNESVKAEFEEQDTILEDMINIGVPGALWYASSEIVDDEDIPSVAHDSIFPFAPVKKSQARSESNVEMKSEGTPSGSNEEGHSSMCSERMGDGMGTGDSVQSLAKSDMDSMGSSRDLAEKDVEGKAAPVQTLPEHLNDEVVDGQPEGDASMNPQDEELVQHTSSKDAKELQYAPIDSGKGVHSTFLGIERGSPKGNMQDSWTWGRAFRNDLISGASSTLIYQQGQPTSSRSGRKRVECCRDRTVGQVGEGAQVVLPAANYSPYDEEGNDPPSSILGRSATGEITECSEDLVESTSVDCGDAAGEMTTPRDMDDEDVLYLLDLSDADDDPGTWDESPKSPRIKVALHDDVKKGGHGKEEVTLRLTVEGITDGVASHCDRACSSSPSGHKQGSVFDLSSDKQREQGTEVPVEHAPALLGTEQGNGMQEFQEIECLASIIGNDQQDQDQNNEHVMECIPLEFSCIVAKNSSVYDNPLFEEAGGSQFESFEELSDGVQVECWDNLLFGEDLQRTEEDVELPGLHIELSTRWVSLHDLSSSGLHHSSVARERCNAELSLLE